MIARLNRYSAIMSAAQAAQAAIESTIHNLILTKVSSRKMYSNLATGSRV
jgi:hypothetical protein